jgi:hypothetical protein
MKSFTENPVNATNEIRERLKSDLNNLSLNLATENHYECFKTCIEVANTVFVEKLKLKDNTINRFHTRQQIAERLKGIEKTEPEKMDELDLVAKKYIGLVNKLNLRNWVLEKQPFKLTSIIWEGLLLFLTIPFFISGFICNFLPFFLPVYIRKNVMKAEYEGFFSSLQFGIGIFVFPFFYIMQTILFSNLTSSGWLGSLVFLTIQYPVGKIAIHWNRIATKFTAKVRFLKLKNKKSVELIQAQQIRERLIGMIS